MSLSLVALTRDIVPAVEAFHERLAAGGVHDYRFGTQTDDGTDRDRHRVWQETLLAWDGTHVRGGIVLQHHRLHTPAGPSTVVNIQLPLSEGTVDRQYVNVGMWVIRAAVERHPRAFAVGMGGIEQPLPRLLKALRWAVQPVPFLVHVHRAGRVLTQLPQITRSPIRRTLGRLAQLTGSGAVLAAIVQESVKWRAPVRSMSSRTATVRIDTWDDATNDIWSAARTEIVAAVERETHDLAAMYPLTDARLLKYLVKAGERVLGWFVLLCTPMSNSQHFGNLVVGTILDIAALPGEEVTLAVAARNALHGMGVEISLTNQLHHRWSEAFTAAGYLSAPSNYIFAGSPALMKAAGIEGPGHSLAQVHITRGDGDGRIHL